MAKQKSPFRGGAWEKFKIIMAIFCLIVMVLQIKSGIDMINENNNLPPLVTNYDSVSAGQSIRGEITHFEAVIDTSKETEIAGGAGKIDFGQSAGASIEPVKMYIYITDAKQILVFRTTGKSSIDSQLSQLSSKQIDSVQFRGYVREMKTNSVSILNTYLLYTNFIKNHNLEGGTQDTMMRLEVDITAPDSKISDKAIIATFVGAVLMFLLALLFLKKIIKNAYISIYLSKHPEEGKRLLSRNGVIFEDEGLYQGSEKTNGEFFVNTEHNVRGEGSFDEQPEELMTHMVADGDFFYEGGLNEEGNFYIDSETKTVTRYGDPDDPDNMLKKY